MTSIDTAVDATPSSVVSEVLTKDNYGRWRNLMEEYLKDQGLWDAVIYWTQPDGLNKMQWREKNDSALKAIKVSCGAEILDEIKEEVSACYVWDNLGGIAQYLRNGVETGLELREKLLNAIYHGDLSTVEQLYFQDPNLISRRMLTNGYTALHVAIVFCPLNIVEELIGKMSPQDLENRDDAGDTALSVAALNGKTQIAKHLVAKNRRLLTIPNYNDEIPVVLACSRGLKDMTHYLYIEIPLEFLSENKEHAFHLLKYCITTKMFDIALDLLRNFPRLAITRSFLEESSIIVTLAKTPSPFHNETQLTFWQRWIYKCIRVEIAGDYIKQRRDPAGGTGIVKDQQTSESSDQRKTLNLASTEVLLHGLCSVLLKFQVIKQIHNLKLMNAYACKVLRLICEALSTLDRSELRRRAVVEAPYEAIKNGILEIVIEITANKHMLWSKDPETGSNMLMYAVLHRQEKIATFLYGLDVWKDKMVTDADDDEHNLLQVAAQLPPHFLQSRFSYAALQFQSELPWSKAVEGIVPPSYKDNINKDFKTPLQVFTDQHRQLHETAVSWMKETANSCTVVGTLIITVMFAAAFTVPGGNSQYTGFPILSREAAFMAFIISDSISLFAASSSVLTFLGIHMARYDENDFQTNSLMKKLVFGFSMLFISIAAMMVAFCASLLLMLENRRWAITPIMLFATVPVCVFAYVQFPLLMEIFSINDASKMFAKNRSWTRKVKTRCM